MQALTWLTGPCKVSILPVCDSPRVLEEGSILSGINKMSTLIVVLMIISACGGDSGSLVLADAITGDGADGVLSPEDVSAGEVDGAGDPFVGGGCTSDDDCQGMPGLSPCRRAYCLVGSGVCVLEGIAEGGSCDPGDPCVVGASCHEGECRGSARVCDDGNECTSDVCDQENGGCVYVAREAGTSCDDGDPCSVADACTETTCVGVAKVCESPDDPCLAATCDPSDGACVTTILVGEPCDDEAACTLEDVCDAEGACAGIARVCDDENDCTADACDPQTGGCVFTPGVDGICDDGNDCTIDTCDPATGACVFTPVGDEACDDDNPCTNDSCDIGKGTCAHTPITGLPCDDEDACTEEDRCALGACSGTPIDCDDEDLCTEDSCVGAGCVHEALTGPPCDDGDACSGPDLCVAGSCVATGLAPGCCAQASDCPTPGDCETVACVAEACVYEPLVCEADDDPCAWSWCEDGACTTRRAPDFGVSRVFHEGFEEQVSPLVDSIGEVTQNTNARQGKRVLRVTGSGTALRLGEVYVPGGTVTLDIWVRPSACNGAGFSVAVDGVVESLGCTETYTWSVLTILLSADEGAKRDIELVWTEGSELLVDAVSITLHGRRGCVAPDEPFDLALDVSISDLDVAAASAEGFSLAFLRIPEDVMEHELMVGRTGTEGWQYSEIAAGEALAVGPAQQNDFNLSHARLDNGASLTAVGGYSASWPRSQLLFADPNGDLVSLDYVHSDDVRTVSPALTLLRNQTIFLAWSTTMLSGGAPNVPLARFFSATGLPLGEPWEPASEGSTASAGVAVAELSSGQTVVVWTRDAEIFAAVAESSGLVATPEFSVSLAGDLPPALPSVAGLPGGQFVVVWQTVTSEGTDLRGRIMDRYGSVIVSSLSLAESTDGNQRRPEVVADALGHYVVAWDSDHERPAYYKPMARVFAPSGQQGSELALDPDIIYGRHVNVGLLEPGRVMFAWQGALTQNIRGRLGGMSCSDGQIRCEGDVPHVCIGTGYAPLMGACTGESCGPPLCP